MSCNTHETLLAHCMQSLWLSTLSIVPMTSCAQYHFPMATGHLQHIPMHRYWFQWLYSFFSFFCMLNLAHICSIVTSRALGYPTHRLGLMILESRGVWTKASARALCRPSVAVQVFRVVCRYMHFPRVGGKSQSREYHRNSLLGSCKLRARWIKSRATSVVQKMSSSMEDLSWARVGKRQQIEVDIRTGKTYMLCKSYICAMEVKGWTKGTGIKCGKHVGTVVTGRQGGTHTCGANHIVT